MANQFSANIKEQEGGEMHKIPYVIEYKTERVEFKEAEDLLAEYQDFYLYNQSQYNEIFRKFIPDSADPTAGDGEEDDEKLRLLRMQKAEESAKSATAHWAKLFGSKDFAEVTLLGLKINWYDLQQILIEEFRKKIHSTESAMNYIAPPLRRLCSVLLFSEHLDHMLDKMSDKPKIEQAQIKKAQGAVKTKLNELLTRISNGDIFEIPEFGKTKPSLSKLKTPESIHLFIEEF